MRHTIEDREEEAKEEEEEKEEDYWSRRNVQIKNQNPPHSISIIADFQVHCVLNLFQKPELKMNVMYDEHSNQI